MAFAAILLGFSSATQDIVIDAYRIESAEESLQALMSSTYIAGYRIGMLASGAGALILASYFGSDKGSYHFMAWHWTYLSMASIMLVGVITTLLIPEPEQKKGFLNEYSTIQYLKFLLLFMICIVTFIITFVLLKEPVSAAKTTLSAILGSQPVSSFIMEFLKLMAAAINVALLSYLLVSLNFVEKELIWESYIEPVNDFFKRYE